MKPDPSPVSDCRVSSDVLEYRSRTRRVYIYPHIIPTGCVNFVIEFGDLLEVEADVYIAALVDDSHLYVFGTFARFGFHLVLRRSFKLLP